MKINMRFVFAHFMLYIAMVIFSAISGLVIGAFLTGNDMRYVITSAYVEALVLPVFFILMALLMDMQWRSNIKRAEKKEVISLIRFDRFFESWCENARKEGLTDTPEIYRDWLEEAWMASNY